MATNLVYRNKWSLSLYLVAEEAPVIANGEDVVNVITGHTAVIRCQATGAPQPLITWYKDR